MAQHHFYSCVPARLSIYRKVDGYDTFLQSSGINAEWIDSELSAVCNYKETKNEVALIREKKLSPAYGSWLAKDKQTLIQTCISYTDKDYTGEKSAHLIHNVILSPEEKAKLTDSDTGCLLNSDMFVSDIANIDLASLNIKLQTNHPENEYTAPDALSPADVLLAYPDKIIKRLLFALLTIACGKSGKYIYITFGGKKVEEISPTALAFMNSILTLFPYNLRSLLPFITYQSDYSKFPQFKIKFLPNDCMSIPSGKGYQFDMTPRLADGIRDEEYMQMYSSVELLYSMIENEEIRTSFLHFYDAACKRFPEQLLTPNAKTFSGMVMLFQQSSGLYDTKRLLRDDKTVLELFSIYEKYYKALDSKQRSTIYASVERYLTAHTMIPQDIFSKFCRMYPHEADDTKETAMDIVLRMMHTDIMRQKLFQFIKNNFASETPQMKERICIELCSVFYGGFLQGPIMDLLFPHYFEEPEKIRFNILETMLSSIRTVAVQNEIIAFTATHFADFSADEKALVLATAFQMLPENDDLTVKLLDLLNRIMPSESDELKAKMLEKLWHVISVDQGRKEPKFLPILMQTKGYCEDAVMPYVFRKKTKTQVAYFRQMTIDSLMDTTDRVVRIYRNVPAMSNKLTATFSKFIVAVTKHAIVRAKLADVVASDEIYAKALPTLPPDGKALVTKLTAIFNEHIIKVLPNAFTQKGRQQILPQVIAYTNRHPNELWATPYTYIRAKRRLTDCFYNNDISNMAAIVLALDFADNDTLRADFAETVKVEIEAYIKKPNGNVSGKTIAALSLLIGFIRVGEFDAILADEKLGNYLDKFPLPEETIQAQPLFSKVAIYSAVTLITTAAEIINSAQDNQRYLDALHADEGATDEIGFVHAAKMTFDRCGKKDYRALLTHMSTQKSLTPAHEAILSIYNSILPTLQSTIKSLFTSKKAPK